MRKRRAPNKTERLAAALLQIKRGDEWLIPEPLRSSGDAAAICRHVEWDHKFLKTWGGDESPQNMQPLTELEHKAKTRRDRQQIAKANRITKKHEEFRRQLLAKETNELFYVKPGKRKNLTEYTRLKKFFKRKLSGSVVLREREKR